jgi:hypothetical protein
MNPHIKLKLTTALVKYDERQKRGKSYNRYAFAIYLRGLRAVEEEVDAGASVARAIYDHYQGRLLSALERAIEVPLTYKGGGHDKGRPD